MPVVSDKQAVDQVLTRFARVTEEVFTLDELRERMLSGRQLVMKYGVDLTARDLHLGHAVNLWMYRALQDLGHKVVLLLGDFTTQIGDPTGRNKTRPVLAAEEIRSNAEGIQAQALSILRSDPEVLEIRRNSEWLNVMKPAELLTVMSRVTVERLLSRDMFRRRLGNGEPISVHEVLYPILQGWDSVALDADLTIIGTDQLFNEMMGRFLQEKEGQRPQIIITTKITPGLDGGEKQSKSLGNYVAVAHPPREKFGRLMRLIDPLVGEWLRVYSDVEDEEIDRLLELQKASPLDAKYAMATAIVERYHGVEVAKREQEWFRRTFSARQAPDDAESVQLDQPSISVYDLVRRLLGPGQSNSEVRRLIMQGGVSVDGERRADGAEVLVFGDEPVMVKLGKRRWFSVSSGTSPDFGTSPYR